MLEVPEQITPEFPSRIVCLTEETTETLYLLGEEHRIVGVSGYTVRPAAARSKPKVSAFTSAKIDSRWMGLQGPHRRISWIQNELTATINIRAAQV